MFEGDCDAFFLLSKCQPFEGKTFVVALQQNKYICDIEGEDNLFRRKA